MAGTEIPYGYCHCGCGEKAPIATKNHTKNGYVKGEPRRFIQGHSSRRPKPLLIDPVSLCWLWTAHVDKQGYGRLESKGAHIIFWERRYGPVPDGLELDHLCRVRRCVNPDHLEAVTHAENMRRGKMVKLTWEAVEEIRAVVNLRGKRARLAERFGVSCQAISDVHSGRVWKRA